jgi:hypothetical protein
VITRFDRAALAGVVLPFAAIGIGLLIPRSPLTEALFPGVFVISGALIGCWWAPVPALVAVTVLSLLDLTDIHYYAAVEIHGGSFEFGFFLLTASAAAILVIVGAGARIAIEVAVRRRRATG